MSKVIYVPDEDKYYDCDKSLELMYKGKKYYLITDAVTIGGRSYGDGIHSSFEMRADAIDDKGELYIVNWVFEDVVLIDGENTEEHFDYNDECNIKSITSIYD